MQTRGPFVSPSDATLMSLDAQMVAVQRALKELKEAKDLDELETHLDAVEKRLYSLETNLAALMPTPRPTSSGTTSGGTE